MKKRTGKKRKMENKTGLAQWLESKLNQEHLSLRQAAMKTGLSHATLADIINGSHPLPETLKKLAKAFGGPCRLALEDHLFALTGYRRERLGEEQPYFLKTIPLLSVEHQQVVEVLVREMARIEGIEALASEKEIRSDG